LQKLQRPEIDQLRAMQSAQITPGVILVDLAPAQRPQ
jgi:hypothetical protein